MAVLHRGSLRLVSYSDLVCSSSIGSFICTSRLQPQARGHYASSLTLCQRIGNRLGEARIENHLGALDGLARDPLARRALTYSVAAVARGRYRLIGVPQVSDAIRCRDDIRVVQF
jgi:hypothetical protein